MRQIDYLKEDYHENRHWKLNDRSHVITNFMKKYGTFSDKILELGCSSGRNLISLHKAGFKNLTGLEMYPVKNRSEFKLIRDRWEEVELEEYDIMFSASFLQEFEKFPQTEFNKALKKCKKYFMIFGDYLGNWEHEGFEVIEEVKPDEYSPFSQPIIILCKVKN